MRLSIPHKVHPKAKQHGYWFGQDGRKSKKSHFSGNFDLFFGISMILIINFTDFFAATNISTYFKFIPIDIFMKTFFSDDI